MNDQIIVAVRQLVVLDARQADAAQSLAGVVVAQIIVGVDRHLRTLHPTECMFIHHLPHHPLSTWIPVI